MAKKTIPIKFDGYWRAVNRSGLPAESGVYCVYTCTHNKTEGTVTLHKLVYIGESTNVRDRVASHEKTEKWETHLKAGQELCFSCGLVDENERRRAEAALIFKHKPPENTEYRDDFPFDETTISLTGKTALLNANFTVQRT